MKAVAILLGSMVMLNPVKAEAQTIWCRALGVGCPTEADRQKAIRRCEIQSQAEYQGFLQDALANPRLWQELGDASPQAYASRRSRSYLAVCMQHSVPSVR